MLTKNCPKCHKEHEDNARVCECGYNFQTSVMAALPYDAPTKTCTNCGAENNRALNFCRKCDCVLERLLPNNHEEPEVELQQVVIDSVNQLGLIVKSEQMPLDAEQAPREPEEPFEVH